MPFARATLAAACLAAFVLSGCSTPTRLNAVPLEVHSKAVIPGMEGVRYRVGDLELLKRDALEAFNRERALLMAAGRTGPLPPADYLAISGGGENGAFGAGLLLGWTARGDRPEFKLVTGISTGALSAPFAFLGPRYDEKLKQVYTETTGLDILVQRSFIAALYDDAMADNAPLRRLVGRYMTPELLADIRAEHEKGRMLLVATTDLDSRTPVMWNLGKIAASGHPRAAELFRDVLVASAAIPGVFPPMMFDVEVDGKKYQEMHVDGGVMAQVFLYPPALELAQFAQTAPRTRRGWVIRNARLDFEWAEVERSTLSIVGRSISSLIQTQGYGNLFLIYALTQRDKVDFNLAYMPESFNRQLKEPFEREYMRELFQIGYDMAVKGYPWHKRPPTMQELAD